MIPKKQLQMLFKKITIIEREKNTIYVTEFVPNSLLDDFQKGLKIECGRTQLIIRFLGTNRKINILAKNPEGDPKRVHRGKMFRHYRILYFV